MASDGANAIPRTGSLESMGDEGQDNATDVAGASWRSARDLHNVVAGKAAGPGAVRAAGGDPSKRPPGFPDMSDPTAGLAAR